ncbi:DNA-directed RNA polymerase subunit beta [Aerococcaceae bacterium DSM 111176]|nr:DNA-directed RNA polymerase subunit beta [Aerococcaceae bacterium DSM 111176]
MSEQRLEVNVWKRFFFALLKVILFVILFALFAIIGLFIGYTIIGDGNYWEVLNQDTWAHILSFFN